jgi:predicted nuclease with TOPRIM domain
MKTVEEQIRLLNTKLQQLLKKFNTLQKENSFITSELIEYKSKEKSTQEKITLLELETAILKASAGKMNEKEKIDFEKRINQYIKYLENCMTMLNK